MYRKLSNEKLIHYRYKIFYALSKQIIINNLKITN